MVIWLASCVRHAEPQLLVTLTPDQAWHYDASGQLLEVPRDRGLLLVGPEAERLIEGLALSWQDDDLADPDQAPTHEVFLQQGPRRVRYFVHPTAFDERYTPAAEVELAHRLGELVVRPPTHHGHWISVPSELPLEEALSVLARAGYAGFLHGRSAPWVEVRISGAFPARLQQEVPGAAVSQSSSEDGRVIERYELPFGAHMARVRALVEAEGAEIVRGHAPMRYLVSVWTEEPAPPSLPAPLHVAGPYFPAPE